ncbi:MAG TPA: ribonuclease Y [Candidatus Wirthbacteria bacterium]|nr:ribonuclease Y [Candidatus Wirthbacteria bacterium]
METIVLILLTGLIALGAGFFLHPILNKKKVETETQKAQQIMMEAKAKQKELIIEGKDEALKLKQKAEQDIAELRKELTKEQNRLHQKEESLDKRYESLEKKLQEIDDKRKFAEEYTAKLKEKYTAFVERLEQVGEMTRDEAREELLSRVEKDIKEDAIRLIREVEDATKEEADNKAREILSIAIQRVATDHTADITVRAVEIPNDEMKGRIIGREGRNIRALEKATGVDFIVDDTPETILISSFDPLRREIARVSLLKLVSDGRIHPGRIEEIVEKAEKEVEKVINEAGRKAAADAKVPGLKSDVIRYLGMLKFRTSYGQNVLQHSIESALLAANIAAEMGADVSLVRKAALLHDLGKAIDHKIEGGHAEIGADLLKKLGFSDRIVYAVRAHHEDVSLKTPEDFIVLVSDAISGSRLGARHDTAENYIERLQKLEEIANSFSGVDKSYAIQAGREIRIMVNPEQIDDLQAHKLAREAARKIEEGLDYPGQIKVNVIRETRSTDYAK